MRSMKELRESNNLNTRVLYHINYWDGPISGICLWEGKKHYFNCKNIDDITRVYTVYQTPQDDIDIIEENHELFQKYVGTHTDYDKKGLRHYNLRPSSQHRKFYDTNKRQPKIDLEKCGILGRFKSPF